MTETTLAPKAEVETEAKTWFPGRIEMPYTLTPGRAVGVFLAELREGRLVGSLHGDEILVPAQDFSGTDGRPLDEFVEVDPIGTVATFTEADGQVLAFIEIAGTEAILTHRLIELPDRGIGIGDTVEAVWAEQRTGAIGDIVGFRPTTRAAAFAPRPIESTVDPVEQVDYTMVLDYEHAYGHYYGTLFDGIRTDRRVRGVRCSACERVLLPPRAVCDVCQAKTQQWVDVAAVGTVQASSVVHIEFVGQRMKPPYVYAEIVLDGTSTRLIHQIGDIDPDTAKTKAAPGARVEAVWSDRRTGSLADIEYFRVVDA